MSTESAKEFIDELWKNDFLRMQFQLAEDENEAVAIAKTHGYIFTNEEAKIAIQEELGPVPPKNVPDSHKPIKLIENVDSILKNHEERFAMRCDEWDKNVFRKPDYVYNEIDVVFHTNIYSPSIASLRNLLFHLLKSDYGTRCKAEDILDPLYTEHPELKWPRINYMPSRHIQPCHTDLLVWCFDEDNLEKRLGEMIDHLETRHEQSKDVVFLTSKWSPELYVTYSDKVETLKNEGCYFTFIFFTMLGATEISTHRVAME